MDHNQLGREKTHRFGCGGMFYFLGVVVAGGGITCPPDGLRQKEKTIGHQGNSQRCSLILVSS